MVSVASEKKLNVLKEARIITQEGQSREIIGTDLDWQLDAPQPHVMVIGRFGKIFREIYQLTNAHAGLRLSDSKLPIQNPDPYPLFPGTGPP